MPHPPKGGDVRLVKPSCRERENGNEEPELRRWIRCRCNHKRLIRRPGTLPMECHTTSPIRSHVLGGKLARPCTTNKATTMSLQCHQIRPNHHQTHIFNCSKKLAKNNKTKLQKSSARCRLPTSLFEPSTTRGGRSMAILPLRGFFCRPPYQLRKTSDGYLVWCAGVVIAAQRARGVGR